MWLPRVPLLLRPKLFDYSLQTRMITHGRRDRTEEFAETPLGDERRCVAAES